MVKQDSVVIEAFLRTVTSSLQELLGVAPAEVGQLTAKGRKLLGVGQAHLGYHAEPLLVALALARPELDRLERISVANALLSAKQFQEKYREILDRSYGEAAQPQRRSA